MKKALSLRMFPDGMPTLRRLDIAREAGFEGVELNLEPRQEFSLEWERREEALAAGMALPPDVVASLRGLAEDFSLDAGALLGAPGGG